jgi:hypothetical protein
MAGVPSIDGRPVGEERGTATEALTQPEVIQAVKETGVRLCTLGELSPWAAGGGRA